MNLILRVKKFLYKYPLVFISLIAFTVFFNMLFNDFVWLDYPYVLNNPALANPNIENLFRGSAATGVGYYRPIAALVLGVQRITFEAQPFFYHFFQVGLRVLNVYLLFLLFHKFFSKKISLYLSLIYLVHPLNISQVAFISSISDMLFLTFGLLGLTISLTRRITFLHFLASSFFFLLSILSKESGVIFLVASCIAQFHYGTKKGIYFLISNLTTFLIYIFLRLFLTTYTPPEMELYPFYQSTLIERLISAPKILFFYFSKFIFPYAIGGLHMWTIENIDFKSFFLPLILDLIFLAIIAGIGIYIFKKREKYKLTYIFFLSLFIIGQLLNLHIIPLDYTVAGRWFAVPMIGILGMIGTMIHTTFFYTQHKKIIKILAIILLIYFSVFTIRRNFFWRNNISLFTRWSEINNNYAIENLLANSYYMNKDYKNAEMHSNRSISMFVFDNNLSLKTLILEKQGKINDAYLTAKSAEASDNYSPKKHDPTIYSELIQFYIRNNYLLDAKNLILSAKNDYPEIIYFSDLYTLINKEFEGATPRSPENNQF